MPVGRFGSTKKNIRSARLAEWADLNDWRMLWKNYEDTDEHTPYSIAHIEK